MDYTNNLRNIFTVITMLVIGAICFIKIGTIDMHAILSAGAILLPAMIVMGYLGQKIGEIIGISDISDLKPYSIVTIGYPAEGWENKFMDKFDEDRIHYEKY